ncbi:MAG: hypothetical protein CEE38_23475 [Planctomycetes bacterium B3_Pla]|nr:MAG: hypothetical protein CEE38_23475 [Planctomycetes bacterium B3_Pla]
MSRLFLDFSQIFGFLDIVAREERCKARTSCKQNTQADSFVVLNVTGNTSPVEANLVRSLRAGSGSVAEREPM